MEFFNRAEACVNPKLQVRPVQFCRIQSATLQPHIIYFYRKVWSHSRILEERILLMYEQTHRLSKTSRLDF